MMCFPFFLREFSWFIFLLYLFRVSDGAFRFTQEPSDPSYFKKGTNATLVWDYTVDNQQTELQGIIWSVLPKGQSSSVPMLVKTGDADAVPHPNIPSTYKGRVYIRGKATLVIVNITLQDKTRFRCTLRAKQGSGLTDVFKEVTLSVTETPLISEPSVDPSYNEGSPVSINCSATGTPDPHVKWVTGNGETKSSGKKSALLTFNSIHRTDDGQYTCKANNSAGQTEKSVTLVVHYSATVASYSPTTTKSWIGQTVKLKCVSDGVPTPIVTWFKPDGRKQRSVTAKENTVDVRMAGDEDFGDYKCITDNGLQPADTATVTVLQITKPGAPNITSSGEDIQATSLIVKWSKPADNGGSPITAYRVVLQENGAEIKNENVTDPGQRNLSVGGLDKNTEYDVSVFARNFVFEGTAGNKKVRTKFVGKPAAAKLINVPKEVKGDEVTLSWSEPANNGADITQFTVYQRTVSEDGTTGDWIQVKVITDVSARKYVVKVDTGKEYEFVVTATNSFGEALKEESKIQRVKVVGGSGSQAGGHGGSGGMDIGIIAGAAAGGVLLIITLILLIVLWRRRKESHREETSKDALSAERGGDLDEGYASVSRAAAQSLAAAGNSGAVNYAVVDQSTRKKNRHPGTDQYAVVDPSKQNKKKRKNPNQLDYAELADFRPENQASVVVPAGAQAAAAATFRAPVYEGTEYADIAQFGVPQAEDATYANVPKKDDVVYSNVESM